MLLVANLGLLPVWSDELFTLQTVPCSVPRIFAKLQADIHPPLYYLLAHVWPAQSLEGLRALSALWSLLASVLLDLLWTRRWRWPHRLTALGLFSLSPCLLLYGRMARSYSMQTALSIIAVWAIWRYLQGKTRAWVVWAALTALLYTHYVPGLALLGAFLLLAWRRVGWLRATALAATIGVTYLPWLWTLAGALDKWGQAAGFSSRYMLTGSNLPEQGLKVAFGLVSLSIGESFYWPALALVPLVAVAVWLGARRSPHALTTFLVLAAVIGYFGVARWVSYPFIPARLLWLLPYPALAIAAAGRRWRLTLVVLLGTSSVFSVVNYFSRDHYLNKGYVAPLREIASVINHESRQSDLILIDAYNTDAFALAYYLDSHTHWSVMFTQREIELAAKLRTAQDVWIVRNSRDISPGAVTTRLKDQAGVGRLCRTTEYLPYEPWMKKAMAHVVAHAPSHFYELTVCRAD